MIRRTLLVAAVLSVAAAVASAQADTYCVANARCAAAPGGHAAASLTAAISAASAHAGPDRIAIGPGTFPFPGATPTVQSTNDMTEIDGAGRDATILTGGSAGEAALEVDRAGLVVSDLGFRLPDNVDSEGLDLDGAATTARRVDVDGPSSTGSSDGIGISGGAVLDDVNVTLSSAPGSGVYVYGSGGATLSDVTITGGYALRVNSSNGMTTVTRARITGSYVAAYIQNPNELSIADSLLVTTSGGQDTVDVQNFGATTTTLRLTRSTIVGQSGGGIVQAFQSGAGAGTARVILRAVAIAGTGVPFGRTQSGGGITKFDVDDSAFGPGYAAGPADVFGTHLLGAPTGFVDAATGDYRLLWSSPLVDAGGTVAAPNTPTTDLGGGARVVDGTGAGNARVDIGAFEYQRRPPVFDAAASGATTVLGTPLSFLVSGVSDPDPGETPTVRWDFSDGTTAAGPSADHAFAAAGPATATAVATDPAGVTTSKQLAVDVTAPAAPTPPGDGPAPAPGPGPTPPKPAPARPTLRVAQLSIGRDGRLGARVTCAGTVACSGKLVVRTATGKHHVTLARASFSLRAGAARTLRVKLGKTARAALPKGHRVRVVATATGRDALGRTLVSASAKATLRR
ncbi:MAG TPA: PKD domain-containing protein [Baekduia sp.]